MLLRKKSRSGHRHKVGTTHRHMEAVVERLPSIWRKNYSPSWPKVQDTNTDITEVLKQHVAVAAVAPIPTAVRELSYSSAKTTPTAAVTAVQGTPRERAMGANGWDTYIHLETLWGESPAIPVRACVTLTLFGHRFYRAGHGTLDLGWAVAHCRCRRRRRHILRL